MSSMHQDLSKQGMCSGSNSEIQQSCPEASGSFENETSSLYLDSISRQPAEIVNLEVNAIWLEVLNNESKSKFLLLEDAETGDVLIPLLELKSVLNKANNSRPIASLTNRMVDKPANANFGKYSPSQDLYWSLAFESPKNVKAVVKRELGDNRSTRGHIRIVLLPIVYNIMVSKESYWETPFFKALEKAMLNSTYAPLLHKRKAKLDPLNLHGMLSRADSRVSATWMQGSGLFSGPRRLAVSAAKYMRPFSEGSNKRLRTDTTMNKEEAAVMPLHGAPAQLSSVSSTTVMDAQLREHRQLFMDQSARQEALEREVADLKCMLERLSRMCCENRGLHSNPFGSNHSTVCRDASTPRTGSSYASMQFKPQSSHMSMEGPMTQSSPHHPPSVSHGGHHDLADFAGNGPYFASTPQQAMRRERSTGCLPPPNGHRPFKSGHHHVSAAHHLSLPHSSSAPLMPFVPPSSKRPDGLAMETGVRCAAFEQALNLCNPQDVRQCSMNSPNLVYAEFSSENPVNIAHMFPPSV